MSLIDFFSVLKFNGFPVLEARQLYTSFMQVENRMAWQEEKKWEIFNWQVNNNPFYKHFSGGAKNAWEEVPIIRKDDLKGDLFQKLPTGIRKKDLYISATSGSTGSPMGFARDKLAHVLVWLGAENNYRASQLKLDDYQARFYGMPLVGLRYYREVLKDYLANRYRFVVFDLSEEVIHNWVQIFSRKKFKCAYGYTNSILQVAEYLTRKNIVLKDVCPTLKASIITSEMCSDREQALITDAFGVPVFNEYGASEVCVMGYKQFSFWRVADELVYLEVVDENGQVVDSNSSGRLLCTLLHNRATPIIRYEIGDMATLKRENNQTYITSLLGRMNDLGILPSGKRIPGLTFYYAVHQALGDDVSVKEHQVIQKAKDLFEVNVVADKMLNSEDKNRVKNAFDLYLEEGLEIRVNQVDKIVRSGNGKFKHFVSYLS